MNKKITVGITAAFVFIAITITFCATWLYAMKYYDSMIINVQERAAMYDRISEVDDAVRQNFYSSIDDDTIISSMIDGYIGAVNDTGTRYVTAKEITEIQEAMKGTSVGIGVYVEQNASGYAVVRQVVPESSADKAGVVVGDVIVRVDMEEALVLGFDEVVKKLTGTEGDRVSVSFAGADGQDKTLELVYTQFKGNCIMTVDLVGQDYKYIRFTSFNYLTGSQFRAILNDDLDKQVGGYIIDLRNFDGGYCIEAAQEIMEAMMPAGVQVSGVYSDGTESSIFVTDSSSPYMSVPCVVLVNKNTVGLAELVAATLGTRNNIRVVGESTKGAGTQLKLVKLSDGSGLYISVCEYKGGGKIVFNKTGLQPHFVVLNPEDYLLGSEPDLIGDIQLRKAVEVLDSGEIG